MSAAEFMKLRTVMSVGLSCDLDKPVIVRLGLWDNRAVLARHHTQHNGQLVLVLGETLHFRQRTMDEADDLRRSLGVLVGIPDFGQTQR